MTYTTRYVLNLVTGEPFVFEVADRIIARLNYQKELILKGNTILGTTESLTTTYEFTFFPSYEEVIKIWMENGYTDELITQILKEFGLSDGIILRLIEDNKFVEHVKPWFEGITQDGGRASMTLEIVYREAKKLFSL